ncbi:MAG: hypothetical protein SGPRY_002438 [Prymnesium sp.]
MHQFARYTPDEHLKHLAEEGQQNEEEPIVPQQIPGVCLYAKLHEPAGEQHWSQSVTAAARGRESRARGSRPLAEAERAVDRRIEAAGVLECH